MEVLCPGKVPYLVVETGRPCFSEGRSLKWWHLLSLPFQYYAPNQSPGAMAYLSQWFNCCLHRGREEQIMETSIFCLNASKHCHKDYVNKNSLSDCGSLCTSISDFSANVRKGLVWKTSVSAVRCRPLQTSSAAYLHLELLYGIRNSFLHLFSFALLLGWFIPSFSGFLIWWCVWSSGSPNRMLGFVCAAVKVLAELLVCENCPW